MNREERRKYQKQIKGNPAASKCPICGYISLFYTAPQLKPYEGTKETFVAEDFDTVVKCEICNETVLSSPTITELIQPGVRLPLPLDIFQLALNYEEKQINE